MTFSLSGTWREFIDVREWKLPTHTRIRPLFREDATWETILPNGDKVDGTILDWNVLHLPPERLFEQPFKTPKENAIVRDYYRKELVRSAISIQKYPYDFASDVYKPHDCLMQLKNCYKESK